MSSRSFGASLGASVVVLALAVVPTVVAQTAAARPATAVEQEPPLTMPKPAVPLAPGTMTYRATIALGGQARDMIVTTEIKDDPEGWLIGDTATTPASATTPGGSRRWTERWSTRRRFS